MEGQEENDKKGQWLPSYIRAKRRGSSMKLCRLAFRGSGNEDLLPTEVISLLKNFSVVIIDCCDKKIFICCISLQCRFYNNTNTGIFIYMHIRTCTHMQKETNKIRF